MSLVYVYALLVVILGLEIHLAVSVGYLVTLARQEPNIAASPVTPELPATPATCGSCHRAVARYTITETGIVCVNCKPLPK
jgi:hypothetical protein